MEVVVLNASDSLHLRLYQRQSRWHKEPAAAWWQKDNSTVRRKNRRDHQFRLWSTLIFFASKRKKHGSTDTRNKENLNLILFHKYLT